MTSKTIVKRAKSIARLPLDLPMALLAAGSVAFIAFAMPDDLFSRAVALTGLPNVLPAAEPPLGQTARLAVIAASAAATFIVVWLTLRALGPSTRAPARLEDDDRPIAPPRLRRADAHPDAPARRPIFAGLDLGEPMEPLPALEEEPVADELDGSPEEEEERSEALPVWADLPSFLEAPAAPEAPAASEEIDVAAEEVSEQEERPLPSFLDAQPAEPEPFADAAEPAPVFVPIVEAAPAPAPAPVSGSSEEPSISQLMQRLERGVARAQSAAAPAAVEPLELVNPADGRLRSAIGDLRKLTRRGG